VKQLFSFSSWGNKQSLIIVCLFLISVLIRWPNIDRPLSKHHEFVTSISLRVLQVWEDEGVANMHFSPAMNYGGVENKFIDNHATSLGEMHDAEGNYYYISHPPFAYLLPYACFQVIGAKATVLNIQIFHLLLHFLSVVLIILIVRRITQEPKVAFIAAIIYLFLPATLWFQSNTYMSDLFVHVFHLWGILLFIKLWKKEVGWLPSAFLLAFILFLMVYTSWLGVFFGFVVFIWFAFRMRARKRLALLTLTFIGGFAALALTYFQYSSINGSEAYLDQLFQRLSLRGSNTTQADQGFFVEKGKEIGLLIFNYSVHYWYLLVLFLISLIALRKQKVPSFLGGEVKPVLLVSLLPILLLHLCLLNYSGHDFTVLYSSAFFAVFGAFALKHLQRNHLRGALMAVSFLGISTYYLINLPGSTSIKGDAYNTSMLRGKYIGENLLESEVGFSLGVSLDPMVIFYAHRNIKSVESKREALDWLKAHQLENGRIFSLSKDENNSYKIQVKR
jgi:hypothetical protein